MTADLQLDPLPDGVLDKLRRVSTSTLATQLYKRGFRQPQLLGVRPLSQVADGFVAEAFTMRFIPAREDVDTLDPYRSGNTLQWDAIEAVPPGHVIVVDSRGDTRAASGGDMLMTRAWKRGAAGFVTDGGLGRARALPAALPDLREHGHHHHARRLAPRRRPAGADRLRRRRRLSGRRPGRRPRRDHRRPRCWPPSSPIRRSSRSWRRTWPKIQAGLPLAGNYPPGEETIAEYKKLLAEAGRTARRRCGRGVGR